MDHQLVCQSCGATHPPGRYPSGCPTCLERDEAGWLQVEMALDEAPPDIFPPDPTALQSMWRYRELLPLIADDPVTISEGWTPLVSAPELSADLGPTVHLKNETTNPTWSYKDRLNALLVSNIVALVERPRIATASTGNHGASTAAYARRAGVDDVIVLLPHETGSPCAAQVIAYGGQAIITGFDERRHLLSALVERGWYPTVNASWEHYTGQPYGVEGYKTIAFELVEQLGEAPDVVSTGVGDGDGLYGIWKGFVELDELGVIDRLPRMIGVQTEERQPLVRALAAGVDEPEPDRGPVPLALSAGTLSAGPHVVRAVRESGGTAYAMSEEDVIQAVRETGHEGVFPEPASALPTAGLRRAVEDGIVEPDETAVCVVTGAGVKWPEHARRTLGDAPVIEPTIEALRETVPFPID